MELRILTASPRKRPASVSEGFLFQVIKFYAPQARTALRGISVRQTVKLRSARQCREWIHTP